MNPELKHLLTLAKAGRNAGATEAEFNARQIVSTIVERSIGLDGSASAGIAELIGLVQRSPMEGRDMIKDITGLH